MEAQRIKGAYAAREGQFSPLILRLTFKKLDVIQCFENLMQ
jgi:hypothetical protein